MTTEKLKKLSKKEIYDEFCKRKTELGFVFRPHHIFPRFWELPKPSLIFLCEVFDELAQKRKKN